MKKINIIFYCLIFSLCFFLVGCKKENIDEKKSMNPIESREIEFVVDDEVYATVSSTNDEIIEIPTNPSKDGFIFDGWYWDENVWEKPFTSNSLKNEMLNSEMKVYAKWNHAYNIIYHLDGGVNGNNPTQYYTESETIILKDASKAGYFFVGWYLDSLYTLKTISIPTGSEGDINLYAKFVKNVSGFSYEETRIGGDFGYAIVSYNGDETSLYIPTTYNNQPVIEIKENAFANASKIKTLIIPENILRIEKGALSGCVNLESITLPFVGNSTYNGSYNNHFGYIFGASSYGSNADYVPTKLTSVEITNASSISGYAFFNCKSIEILKFSNTVNSIGQGALRGCDNIDKITLPFIGASRTATNDYTQVFGYIFGYKNYNLEDDGEKETICQVANYHYYIPSSIKEVEITDTLVLGDNAFNNCVELLSIKLPYTLQKIGANVFANTKISKLEISSQITTIKTDAFKDCSLQGIYYTGTMKEWCEDYYFTGREELFKNTTSFYIDNQLIYGNLFIPNDVENIVPNAFKNCNTIYNLKMADSVVSIGTTAFADCTNLITVEIPNSVVSIGGSAFKNCTSLREMKLPFVGGRLIVEDYIEDSISKFEYIFGLDDPVDGEAKIPSNLDFVKITNAIVIKKNAFVNCTSISYIILPDTLKTIEERAFLNCARLQEINIPKNVTNIGLEIFKGCANLKKISVDKENSVYDSRNNCNAIIETETNKLIAGCEGSTIPDGVEILGNSSFAFTKISSVSLPNTLKTIEKNAFYNCGKLRSVSLNESIQKIEEYAFMMCVSLETISIPKNVTDIGTGVFAGCLALMSITVNSENTIYDSRNNCNAILETKTDKIIAGCKFSNIPNETKIIGDCSFLSIEFVNTEIEFSSNLTFIGKDAFAGTNLTKVIIPDSVTDFEDGFYGCVNLETLKIPFLSNSYDNFLSTHQLSSVLGPYYPALKNLTILGTRETTLSSDPFSYIETDEENGTYEYLSNIETLVLGSNVKSFERGALSNLKKIKELTIPFVGQSLNYSSYTHFGYIFGAGSYSYNYDYVPETLKNVTISGATNISISSNAFRGCSNIEIITLSTSVIGIGSYAFYGCYNLTDIVIENNNSDWIRGGYYYMNVENSYTNASRLRGGDAYYYAYEWGYIN